MARFELSGKVALVTGGARGIGFATAQALLARGASVAIVDLDQAACDAAAEQLHDSRAIGIAADVTDRGAMQRAVARTVEHFGGALRVELVQHGASASVAYFGFIETEMVHRAIDGDPVATEMFGVLPAPLRKRVGAEEAAAAIVRGIERRAPRIFEPRRWALMSLLRGIVNPLGDARMEREERTQALARLADDRAGEDQPTTA